MQNKIFDFLFPVGGGSLGSIITVTWNEAGDVALKTIIAGLIGALCGQLVKIGFDYLKRYLKKKREKS